MDEVKIKKLFFNLSIVSAAIALVFFLITTLNSTSFHTPSLIFRDIIPILSLVLFVGLLFTFQEVKKELAIIPLIIGQASLAFSHTFYYTKYNIGPWTWHAAINSNNVINVIPHILVIIFLFFVLFDVLKSKIALFISAAVAFSPEIMRVVINCMNHIAGISEKNFDLITIAQFFMLLAVVLVYMPVKLYLESEETLEKYDLNSIANNLNKYTGAENNDPFNTGKVANVEKEEPEAKEQELKEEKIEETPQQKPVKAKENLVSEQKEDKEKPKTQTKAKEKVEAKEEKIEQVPKQEKTKPKFKQVVPLGADLLRELNKSNKSKEEHKDKIKEVKEQPKEKENNKKEEKIIEKQEVKEDHKKQKSKQETQAKAKQDIDQAEQPLANPYENYNPYTAPPFPQYYPQPQQPEDQNQQQYAYPPQGMPMPYYPYPPQEAQNQMPEDEGQQAWQNQQFNPYYQQPMPPYPPYYYPQQQQPEDQNQQQYAYPPQGMPMPYYPYPPYQVPNQPNQQTEENNQVKNNSEEQNK